MSCHIQHGALHVADDQEMFVELIIDILQVKVHK